MDDQLIIKLFFERSEAAITELSSKYGSLCKFIAKNILGSEQDAEECVNDTYLAVWNTIPPTRPDSLQGYISRVARNVSIKRYRSNTAIKRNSYYDASLEEIGECLENGIRVEDGIIAEELSAQINKFLGTLKKRERVIFLQRYWYNTSISEIARMMGMSNNAVTVHLHRTRGKLTKFLKREELL